MGEGFGREGESPHEPGLGRRLGGMARVLTSWVWAGLKPGHIPIEKTRVFKRLKDIGDTIWNWFLGWSTSPSQHLAISSHVQISRRVTAHAETKTQHIFPTLRFRLSERQDSGFNVLQDEPCSIRQNLTSNWLSLKLR